MRPSREQHAYRCAALCEQFCILHLDQFLRRILRTTVKGPIMVVKRRDSMMTNTGDVIVTSRDVVSTCMQPACDSAFQSSTGTTMTSFSKKHAPHRNETFFRVTERLVLPPLSSPHYP